MRRDQFRVAQRRVARPRPPGVVHVVHLRAAEFVEAAEFVHDLDLLLDGIRNLILREQLADAAVLTFGARTVVAPDVDDERVVADAEPVEFVDHAARLHVDVLDEAREYFHQSTLKRPLRFRNVVPRGHRFGARRELRVGGNPAEFLLPFERALAQRVPAVVELTLIFVGPLFEDVVRPMARTGRPVHQERLIRRVRAMLAQPHDRLVGEIFAQVVLRIVRRFDRVEVLEQARFPLRRLAGEKPVEIVEADSFAGRPQREWTHRRGFGRGRVVPFAERGALVAVSAEHFRQRRGRARNHAGVAVPINRAFGDRAGSDALMVASGEERCARRRADRRGVECVVTDAGVCDATQRRRVNRAAVRIGQTEADVIHQDDQDVRRILRQVARRTPRRERRVLQAWCGNTRRRVRGERQHRAVHRRWRGRNGMSQQADPRDDQREPDLHVLHLTGLHLCPVVSSIS